MSDEPNWVEREARRRALILRDGPELWRDFKLAVESSVKTWLRIYNYDLPAEIQFSGCRQITEDCFRVRTIPKPGKSEKYFEARFDRPSGAVTLAPHRKVFDIVVQSDGSLKFVSPEKPDSPMSPSDLDQEVLEPFIDALGPRTPQINSDCDLP